MTCNRYRRILLEKGFRMNLRMTQFHEVEREPMKFHDIPYGRIDQGIARQPLNRILRFQRGHTRIIHSFQTPPNTSYESQN